MNAKSDGGAVFIANPENTKISNSNIISCESYSGADLFINNTLNVNIENYYSDSKSNYGKSVINRIKVSSNTLSMIYINMTDRKSDITALKATQRTFSANYSSFSNFSGPNIFEHFTYPNFYYRSCQFLHIHPVSNFIYSQRRVIILDSQFKDCFIVGVSNSIKLQNCILEETNFTECVFENITESAIDEKIIHPYYYFVRTNKVQALKDIKNTRIESSIIYSQITVENCRFEDISNQYSGVVISIADISKTITINNTAFRKIIGDMYSVSSSGAIYIAGYDLNYKSSKICCLENSGYYGVFLCLLSDENSKAEIKETAICSENSKLASIYTQCALTVNVNYSNTKGIDTVFIFAEHDTNIEESLFCNAVLDIHILNAFIHCDKYLSISNSGISNFTLTNYNNLVSVVGFSSYTIDLFNCSIDILYDFVFLSGINIYLRNCSYTKVPNIYYNMTYKQLGNQLVDNIVMPQYDYFPSVEKCFAVKKKFDWLLYLLVPIVALMIISTLIFAFILWRKKQRIRKMEMSISLTTNLVNDFG